ncbi:testis-specific serine/threonine-protein kinase 4-like [Lingula anatina]|uniref:Testis-specific serine/threonine-protein kinase 4-like n=1 Tax=Lingula anatina TaxID=7574 RepID=A0A1S3H1Q0_LINAN|nr:testis-specific serine/threonine-protein kinase 4-like [Lingula anatina]XP_013385282.1 testis-specific serine/threonine-protein kinase 4-like [Lingula anatina]|eukprot:XP_013379948.1 testis-specific serine/threonine-protein kinase 4-like [Lingula anatina]
MLNRLLGKKKEQADDKEESSGKENENNKDCEKSDASKSAGPNKVSVLEAYGFTVGPTLGTGSYATVKEAFSSQHQSKVAIKIISKRKAPSDYLKKFLPREIDVVKILRHPNLVCFLQSIETTNRVYLVMEMAENGDLLEVIKKKKYIHERQAGIWFIHLVHGIDYCHRKGVAHRDLKCENLLLDRQNILKVTDFGFARGGLNYLSGKDCLSQTYCGSYAYAPPEILTGTPYEPFIADIWSMGVVLFIMVFGRLPFDDSNHKKLLNEVQNKVVFPGGKDFVPDDCKDLISKILVKKRDRLSLEEISEHPWIIRSAPAPRHVAPVVKKVSQEISSLVAATAGEEKAS